MQPLLGLLWLSTSLTSLAQQDVGDWPSFRGREACGVADEQALPLEWDAASGKNVLWSTPLPGLAHSSPVVWGERVFVTSARRVAGESELSSLFGSPGYGAGDSVENEGEHDFLVLCLDRDSGELLWQQTARSGVPRIKRHPKSTHANSTPACDAGHVVAFFGSEGLYAYDPAGKLLWKRDLGVLDAGAPDVEDTAAYQWGFASSPVIAGGRVIVQCDVQDQSFLAAFDLDTGEELWRTLRDEGPTWCTPTVHGDQVLTNGYHQIGGYALEDGRELWRLAGGGDVPVPTPVVGHGQVYLTSAHGRSRPVRAVHLDARGDLGTAEKAGEGVAWVLNGAGIYMQTPLVYGEELYCCSDAGILASYDAHTGETLYRERLGDGSSGFSASPVAGDGKLYFTGESGAVYVVAAGPSFELLGVNELGSPCLATPALSRGRIFFRTRDRLLAVEERQDPPR